MPQKAEHLLPSTVCAERGDVHGQNEWGGELSTAERGWNLITAV